jgi:hypothetical protein
MMRKAYQLAVFSKGELRLVCNLIQHMLSNQTIGYRVGVVVGGTQYEP